MKSIKFTVPGNPFGKQRPKFARMGTYTKTYTPKKTTQHEKEVAECFLEVARGRRFKEKEPLDIRIIAYYPIPQSTSKKRRKEMLEHRIRPTVKPDLDNVAKLIYDALNGVAWYDDNAIVDTQVRKPNRYLTNMSMAYFADPKDHVATSIFPICPVDFSTGFYYEFLKGDLARDNVARKPAFGKVSPAKMGHTDNSYKCVVDQIIVGVDQIGAINYQRAGVPASIDPRRSKVRFVSEQQLLHLDILFAESFFKTGVWANEFTGISSGTPSGSQFLKFNDANFDPVNFFDARKREIKLAGRRMPNKLSLGYDSFTALKNHPDILERVKYTGGTANPAIVNEQVLAQVLGFEEVKVLEATYNAAEEGQPDDMKFVCESDGALLTYTTNAPAIDEPSAGYIFTWDMLGNGNYMATDQFEGEGGTHSEFIEGLMSTDMKKTSDDLACYLSACV